MSQDQNIRIAKQFLAGIGAGADPDEIAPLFSTEVRFEVPGDVGALPWIGRKSGRRAASDFFRDTRRLIEQGPLRCPRHLGGRGAGRHVGEVASRVKLTGKVIESAFALILDISDSRCWS